MTEWFKEHMVDYKKPISSSGILTALGCARKFLYSSKWRLYRKAKQYSASATFGKILHRLLQVGEDATEKVHQEIIKQHSELLAQIQRGEDLVGEVAREADELHDSYTKALAVATIFWERFPPAEHMETVSREEKIEGVFDLSLPIVGFVDWVVRDKRDGSVWIRDTKTTSRSFDSILTGFEWSVQCRFYRLLAKNKTWGADVKGFILDMVKVPTIKMCGKDEKNAAIWGCTVFEAYVKRVKDWYAEQEGDAMKSVAIAFHEPVLCGELLNVLSKIDVLWNTEAVPENFCKDLTRSSCYAYEKVCPYHVLCSSDPVTWPATMEQLFEVVPEHKDRKEID
jgi:hypothetical protein